MTASTGPWPQPDWLDGDTDETDRHRYLLNLACVFHSRNAKLSDLAEAIGMSANAFALMKMRGRVSPETAIEIERTLGKECFPRELFHPNLYSE